MGGRAGATTGLTAAFVGLLLWSVPASAQRVLECSFVSVTPSSSTYGHWSFAADIANDHLSLLLFRPPTDDGPAVADPYVRTFTPLEKGRSEFHALAAAAGGGTEATFSLATLGPGDLVTVEEWAFGNGDVYHRLQLRCPAHP